MDRRILAQNLSVLAGKAENSIKMGMRWVLIAGYRSFPPVGPYMA